MGTTFTFSTDDPEVATEILAVLGNGAEPPKAASKSSSKSRAVEPDDDDGELEDYTEADLKKLPVADLKVVAKDEFDIDIKGLKKPELIEEILAAQDETEDLDDDEDSEFEDDLDDEEDEDELEDEPEPPARARRSTKKAVAPRRARR